MEAKSQPQIAPLPALTAIRGIASFWVLLYHLRHEFKHLFPAVYRLAKGLIKSGFLGVDLFFVLSGFVLALNYQRKFQTVGRSAYVEFLWKRLARIYPVYVACLLITLVIYLGFRVFDVSYAHMDRFTLLGFLQSLTMTQVLSFPVPRQWNVVAWSVSAEWFAYLGFPFLALYVNRIQRVLFRALHLLGVMVGYVAVLYVLKRPSAMELGLFRIMGGFTMGVLLYDLSHAIPATITTSKWWLVVGLLGLAMIPCLYLYSYNAGLASVVWGAVAFVPVILAFSFAGAQWGVVTSPVSQYLGKISYSVYMIHGVLFMLTRELYAYKTLIGSSAVLRGAYIACNVLLVLWVAHFLYSRVEEPARHFLLRKVRRTTP